MLETLMIRLPGDTVMVVPAVRALADVAVLLRNGFEPACAAHCSGEAGHPAGPVRAGVREQVGEQR